MANQTVTVLEADGVTSTDVEVLGFGRQAAAASKSVAASTEDKAVLDAIAASLALLDNVTQTANAPVTTDVALVVAIHPDSVNANGQATMANSAPVTLASNQDWPVSTTGFMKKEDVANADGDAGIPAMVVRKATPANLSGTDGDYEFLQASAGSLWVASVATDKTLVSERVIAGGSHYETVAASQSDQSLGATGATGDYLESLICVVATAATSQVQIKDGAGSAITVLPNAVGAGIGTYILPVGLISLAGAWKVTTAAGVSVIATGRFT
jgi:hypothetical protein